MAENSTHGNLSETSFPQLLFFVWKTEKTGCLKIRREGSEADLFFSNGNIVISTESIPQKEFLKFLIKKSKLLPSNLKECEQLSTQENISLIKAFLSLHSFSPSSLWENMELYLKEMILPLFDSSQAEYSFDPSRHINRSEIFSILQTTDIILEGIRRMKNDSLISSILPPDKSEVQVKKPGYMDQLKLAQPERYMLNVAAGNKTLKNIMEASELARRQSLKILLALFCLGLIRFPHQPSKEHMKDELSYLDLDDVVERFNSKCSYVYKYMAKEIGPVAVNVLEKCLEEVKPTLPPHFKNIKLGNEGKIELDSSFRTKFNLLKSEERRNFIDGLDEILMAELLAVKKTFGNEHEAVLVKNMAKVGA